MTYSILRNAGVIGLLIAAQPVAAQLVINEVLGSTTGADSEFIELYNVGPGAVEIGGWQVELWDSDDGADMGSADGSSPYVVPAGVTLEAGQFFLFVNPRAQTTYSVSGDVTLPDNAIENSSYTLALRNGFGDLVESIFVTDGGGSDLANIGGNLITPDLSIGPDGGFLPAGFTRVPDGGSQLALLEFSPQPAPSATPTSSLSQPPAAPQERSISEIQGRSHTSPYLGETVRTQGVVTAIAGNGFYVQDPVGDGDPATSEGLFVFTGGAPGLSVGDQVEVSGEVSEFTPGGTATRNLSSTQMAFPQVQVTGAATLPEAVVIGQGGRVPPASNIDDDAFASFDPATDGIDFFESLEAMRVRVAAPLAVAPTNGFGEIFTVADGGAGASGLSSRQTINIAPDDFNPEKIQIDFDEGILPGFVFPAVDTGSRLTDVTGVVGYDFGNFQVHPTEAFDVIPGGLAPATSHIQGSDSQLTLASYNVLNLDPQVERIEQVVGQRSSEIDDDIGLGRFDAIAAQIVSALNTPDIIALQEVQDNDGAEVSEVAGADVTLQTLVEAIERAGGPRYRFLDTEGLVPAFFSDNGVVSPVGGQPGGNIRPAFLYNPERVSLIGSAEPLTDPADQAVNPDNPFYRSRIPLVARFSFNDQELTLVNAHLSSKGGSAPILGTEQPFEARQEDPTVNGSLDERRRQALAISAFVDERLSADPQARIAVVGDLNEFEFISPVRDILGERLHNTTAALPASERYSFIFQGNSQQLDHILLSDALNQAPEFEIVHVNSEFADTPERASDHDPLLAGLAFPQPEDLDADGDVDLADLWQLRRSMGAREGDPRFDPRADLDANGRVDGRDLRRVLSQVLPWRHNRH
ncbi:endonuclease/exonuclease/phosphatase family protein [Marinobacter sp.]|uniref:endonuclease/exonuclease/phosphatase family protein n=1 Tax=Marinobacter sp. TaxID=50741 RepID=UPI0019908CAE|nr:endonuclease/exonuclease/phosphatase family protein [Marinobacter sp.]MBC7190747.1 lamin tail domain-containing protein [Marinobacter sp.]